MIQSTQAGILVKNLTKKKFERYWEMIDVDQKDGTPSIAGPLLGGAPSATTCCEVAVTFDDFCELLDFEDMPEEILAKCAHFYLILPLANWSLEK